MRRRGMHVQWTVSVCSVAVIIALTPRAIRAQEQPAVVRSAARAQPIVFVLDDRGIETRGRLVRLDLREAVLLVDGQERPFDLGRVRRIQKRGDSIKDGAFKGALAGFVGGLLIGRLGTCEPPEGVVVQCEDESPWKIALGGAALYGALGAGADLVVRGRTTLYQAPPGTTQVRTTPATSATIAIRLRW